MVTEIGGIRVLKRDCTTFKVGSILPAEFYVKSRMKDSSKRNNVFLRQNESMPLSLWNELNEF